LELPVCGFALLQPSLGSAGGTPPGSTGSEVDSSVVDSTSLDSSAVEVGADELVAVELDELLEALELDELLDAVELDEVPVDVVALVVVVDVAADVVAGLTEDVAGLVVDVAWVAVADEAEPVLPLESEVVDVSNPSMGTLESSLHATSSAGPRTTPKSGAKRTLARPALIDLMLTFEYASRPYFICLT
jgi:hypothetical protein